MLTIPQRKFTFPSTYPRFKMVECRNCECTFRRTLPFLTPLLQAMIQIQWLLGLRPTEVCKMKVGDVDRKSDPDGWVYNLFAHKTRENIGERKIYLAAPVQKLLAPYLKGKKADQFVFSPAESERERRQIQRTERKSKPQPSQVLRQERCTANPKKTFQESYDKNSYRGAIQHAIKKGNKILPSDKQIPHWYCGSLEFFVLSALRRVSKCSCMSIAMAIRDRLV